MSADNEDRNERAIELSAALQRVYAGASSRECLLQEVCRCYVEEGGYLLAWIEHFSDSARFGFARESTDWSEQRELSKDREGVGQLEVPIIGSGGPLGTLHLYSDSVERFDAQEVRWLRLWNRQSARALEDFQLRTLLSQTQRQLSETQERLGILSSTSGIGLVGCDSIARVDWADRNARALLGLRDDEPDAWCFKNVYMADMRRVQDSWSALVDRGEAFSVRCRIRDADRRLHWVGACAKLATSGMSNDVVYVLSVTDKSEEKLAEAKLGRLRTAMEHVGENIVITDLAGAIQYVNPAYEQQTGYSAQELVGRNPRVLNSGQQSAEFYEEMWICLLAGRPWHGRLVNRRKDESLYTAAAVITPIRDEDGIATGYACVEHDLAPTMALQEQLGQSQKMEGMGLLAAGVAHDFNNILTIISASCSFLRSGHHKTEEDVEMIESATSRAVQLTRQLLLFGSHKPALPRVVSVNELVLGMHKMLCRVVNEDVEIVLDLADGEPRCNIDPGEFEQVLMNLAVNAKDAMPDGGTLTFRTSSDHGAVRLMVEDTGHGMSEAVQARVFEPFFTTKSATLGTGLGLSSVFAILQQAQGSISVQSAEGQGCTFVVSLPEVKETQQGENLPCLVEPKGIAPKTVLLVEDNFALRKILQRILERVGYTVVSAGEGQAGLSLIQKGVSADLLITDMVMPGASGSQVATAFKDANPEGNVLFISGYPERSPADLSAQARDSMLLHKPFSNDEFLAAADQLLCM